MASRETLTINFEDDEVQANLNVKELTFQDLDHWVRSRFGLVNSDSLRYMNKLGAEIVPSKSYFENEDRIYIKKIKHTPKKQPTPPFNTFSYTFLCITVTLFLLALYGEKYSLGVKNYIAQFENLLISIGLISKKGLLLEAFIAIVCWSSTYLFIRRLWNPETFSSTFDKYAADSFFGGLAAGASVLLKTVLTKALA